MSICMFISFPLLLWSLSAWNTSSSFMTLTFWRISGQLLCRLSLSMDLSVVSLLDSTCTSEGKISQNDIVSFPVCHIRKYLILTCP